MSSTTKPKKNPLVINPMEQLKDFGSDLSKRVPQEIVNTFIPGAEMWGSPTPKPESMPGGPNFSPVDFAKLQGKYQEQDNPDIDAVRRELMGMGGGQAKNETPELSPEQMHMRRHSQFMNEVEEHRLKREKEEEEKEYKEEMERQEQEKQEAEAAAAAQQQSAPQGKQRRSILGGGKRKANMELPPEVRSERKGGAGKH